MNNNIYAYQHFPISDNYITCFPLKSAIDDGIKPFIFTSDLNWKNTLLDLGYKDVKHVGSVKLVKPEKNTDPN